MKDELKQQFKMGNLGPAGQHLSIEIHWIKKQTLLTQTKYITNMLKHFDMKDCTSKSILMKKKI